MTSRTAAFISKFLCMNVDKNSQQSQELCKTKCPFRCSEPSSYCHLPLFGMVGLWRQAWLFCWLHILFFSHSFIVLLVIVSSSSGTVKELLQGWALDSQNMKLWASHTVQSSNWWTDEGIKALGSWGASVWFLGEGGAAGSRTYVSRLLVQYSFPVPLAFINCQY